MLLEAEHIVHKSEKRITVRFKNRPELVERFKKLTGARWSTSLKSWHLPDTDGRSKQSQLMLRIE
jgi:integrase/recombinase XerD